jgi:hypothetical protein
MITTLCRLDGGPGSIVRGRRRGSGTAEGGTGKLVREKGSSISLSLGTSSGVIHTRTHREQNGSIPLPSILLDHGRSSSEDRVWRSIKGRKISAFVWFPSSFLSIIRLHTNSSEPHSYTRRSSSLTKQKSNSPHPQPTPLPTYTVCIKTLYTLCQLAIPSSHFSHTFTPVCLANHQNGVISPNTSILPNHYPPHRHDLQIPILSPSSSPQRVRRLPTRSRRFSHLRLEHGTFLRRQRLLHNSILRRQRVREPQLCRGH